MEEVTGATHKGEIDSYTKDKSMVMWQRKCEKETERNMERERYIKGRDPERKTVMMILTEELVRGWEEKCGSFILNNRGKKGK